MKNRSAARRYARALYQIAKGRNETDETVQGLTNLVHAIKETLELDYFLLNPLIKPEDKQAVVKSVTSNKLILRFVYLLARRKRLDLLPMIHEEVRALKDVEAGLNRVLVRTPFSLSDAQKKNIETDLARRLGGTVQGQFEVAKDLLGGIWVKMGDKVLDATLKGRFDDMRHALTHSTN